MQRKGDFYTFIFASIICVFCAVVLALAATALKPMQEANIKLDVLVNILGAVGHDPVALKKQGADAVDALFREEFSVLILDKDNRESDRKLMETELVTLGYEETELAEMTEGLLLARFENKISLLARKKKQSRDEYDPGYKLVYVHEKDGVADAYVVPIDGYGLWDNMKGYVALETDLNTIKGITFYEHKETPGLGARVTEDWFKDQFKGKKILDDNGELVSITIAKGKATGGPHEVDGISGATLTGDGMNFFMKDDLARYEPYFKTLRNDRRASL